MPASTTNPKGRAAAALYTRLRAEGVPALLLAHEAYFLSGGVRGTRGDMTTTVPLSGVCLNVPDCATFLADYKAEARCRVHYGSTLIACTEPAGHDGDHTAPTGDDDGVWAWAR